MRRAFPWLAGALALFVALVMAATGFVDEPLRRRMERDLNASLKGYSVRIRELDFHPLGGSLDLVDAVMIQEANPDPPVAWFPKLSASVQWRALLHGRLVADFKLKQPRIYLDLKQMRHETQGEVGLAHRDRGWQAAVERIYPLKINLLEIVDGEFYYTDRGPLRPMHLSGVHLRAENIRNVRSRERTYPSEISLEAGVLDSGHLRVDGRADFLAAPYAGVKATFDLADLDLTYLEPLLRHYDLGVRKGGFSGRGTIEYAPTVKSVELEDATVRDADLDYVKERAAQPSPGEKAGKAAAHVVEKPAVLVKVARFAMERSTLGYRNQTTNPPFRLFVADCNLVLKNFSNLRGDDGTASIGTARARATFMGSGPTDVRATFHPKAHGTDFDIALGIDDTELRTMNDLWRAYGKFDVASGRFSLYAELANRDGSLNGYVKPLFHDMVVPASEEEHPHGIGRRIYNGLVSGVAKVLENHPRAQIATKTTLTGRLDNPQVSALEVLGGLVQNAFFKAILPGLDRERRPR